MNVHSFNDIEGLRIAAEMERRGGEYYRRAAKLSHSPEAVDMLLFLAEDEARHLAEFEKLARRVAQERPDAPEYDAVFERDRRGNRFSRRIDGTGRKAWVR